MIKEAGSDFQIASHYKSPLYLANLTLHKNEIQDRIALKEKGQLTFAVLEAEDDENLEGLNLEGQCPQNAFMPSQEMELLLKLRMQQSLHQKACGLLGRSFKNAVVHNPRSSIKFKVSEKHLSLKLNMRIEGKRNFTAYTKMGPKQELDSLSKLNNSSSNKPIDSEGKEVNAAAFGNMGKGSDYLGIAGRPKFSRDGSVDGDGAFPNCHPVPELLEEQKESRESKNIL